jgi:hypothetical protein
MSQEKVYLRVVNGQVIYPITMANIIASGEPMELFKEVIFAPKPAISQFQQLKEKLTVFEDGVGRVEWIVEELPLNYFLGMLQPRNGDTGQVQTVAFTDIPPDVAVWVSKKIVEEVQKRLDAFAQTRHYDGIVSLTGYATSKRAQRALEGQRGVDVRDNVWDLIYSYQDAIQSGATSVPRSFDEIEAIIAPQLTWEA